jgi:hypothetical protein
MNSIAANRDSLGRASSLRHYNEAEVLIALESSPLVVRPNDAADNARHPPTR